MDTDPNTNGKQSPPTPTPTMVDSEFVIPHLVQHLNQETAAYHQRINNLIYQNALQQGYIDQLKQELAKATAPVEDSVPVD